MRNKVDVVERFVRTFLVRCVPCSNKEYQVAMQEGMIDGKWVYECAYCDNVYVLTSADEERRKLDGRAIGTDKRPVKS